MGYNDSMAEPVIHISEAEATSDFATLLARVRAGAEVIIEHDSQPVAVMHPMPSARRTISECIALLPEDSTATVDPDFAKDVEAAIKGHREPLASLTWD
jgi:antitoxin (DNA-binding transcriptional repressor) of toxin-antitoxin stability system